MWLIHWELSCINSSVEQTFNLVFENTHPAILPDGTFKDVPLGVDPTQWPLDVDVKKTMEAAAQNPLYPGGTFNVYGNFCWGGDKARAEAYFIPAGTKPNANANSRDPHVALQAMQQLQAEHMLGTAVSAGDGYVTFNVPDDEKVLEGTGDNTVARLVVYDNKAHRASAIDEKTVLTLKAHEEAAVVPAHRGHRGARGRHRAARDGAPARRRGRQEARRRRAPPPAHGAVRRLRHAASGRAATARPLLRAAATACSSSSFAADPLAGATARAPGRGVAAPMACAAPRSRSSRRRPSLRRRRHSIIPAAGPRSRLGGLGGGAAPVVQVRCPACGMNTMATPGQPSVCFSCGQPLACRDDEGRWGRRCPRVSSHRRHERAAARRSAEPVRAAAAAVPGRVGGDAPRRLGPVHRARRGPRCASGATRRSAPSSSASRA